MRKTFDELNEQYVPNNTSTNFSNSTCRKRLLDRYIGEGNWSYIYNGRKVVAVEIVEEEEEVELMEEEDVEDIELEEVVEDEPEVTEYTTVQAVDEEIKRCESLVEMYNDYILHLKERVSSLKEHRFSVGSVSKLFSDIVFRKYANIRDIVDTYNEALKRYESNKNKAGIDKEFGKVQEKFMKQVVKHINTDSWSGYHARSNGFDEVHPSRAEWTKLFRDLKGSYDWSKKEAEHYEYKFYDETDWRVMHQDTINIFNYILNQCACFSNTEEYKLIKQTLADGIKYNEARERHNQKGKALFEEFKSAYNTWLNDEGKKEKNRSSYNDDWFNSWFGGSSSRRTGRKYFTGCTTKQELKKRYRELAKQLHPDHGGSNDEFVAMKSEYDDLMRYAA